MYLNCYKIYDGTIAEGAILYNQSRKLYRLYNQFKKHDSINLLNIIFRDILNIYSEKARVEISSWKFKYVPAPKQNNGHDCGAFVLYYAKCLALDLFPGQFNDRDMKYFRQYILRELIRKKLHP